MERLEMGHDYFHKDSLVAQVVADPRFEGFGRFLFPLRMDHVNPDMTVSEIAPLLPYHRNIDAGTTVATLNRLLDDRAKGEKVFHGIYGEGQKLNDPRKNDTGLFFLKGKPGKPFAIISAGGGFAYVGSIHESLPLAIELSKIGYNAFALHYRTGGSQAASEDLAAAIDFVFRNANELQVSVSDYSLWGGSAGARMAANLGSYTTKAYDLEERPRPAAVIMQYTGHANYTDKDPPTYACVGENDGIASKASMERRIKALRDMGIDAEFHVFQNLGHGFGLGKGTSAQGWHHDAVAFWERHMSGR
ncbi:MAG: prolyl oligopeptidase family serine peptidase [Deltaproteobacteria bacterium]|nr:prolyl oligopeptidase family serine peptidase [Deltaproteobacteria bacterium]